MSTRSRDAQLLGRLLTEHAKVPVKVTYHGNTKNRHGGWHVEWTDGPTVASMREMHAKMQDAHSIRCPIRDYSRSSTGLAEACALLRRLAERPEQAIRVGSVMVADAYRETDHPEVADEQTVRRANALLSLSGRARTLTLATLDLMGEHAVRGGFAELLSWLDGISTGADNPDVVNLAEARRRREQPPDG